MDKWGSTRCTQANNIHSAEINDRIKGAVLPEPTWGETLAKQTS